MRIIEVVVDLNFFLEQKVAIRLRGLSNSLYFLLLVMTNTITATPTLPLTSRVAELAVI